MSHSIACFVTINLVFTIKKFIDNPAMINSITRLDVVFYLVFAATALYINDRIWTAEGLPGEPPVPIQPVIKLKFDKAPRRIEAPDAAAWIEDNVHETESPR